MLRTVIYLLLVCNQVFITLSSHHVVRLAENNTNYLVINNIIAKQLVDDDTVTILGFPIDSIKTIALIDLLKFQIGPVIPSIKYSDRSPDDLTRVEILKSYAFNGFLIKESTVIGEYINPAIIKWQDRLLLATGLSWGVAGSKQKAATNTLHFRWVNHTNFPFTTTESYLGIYNEIEQLKTMNIGQDPRFIQLSDPDRMQIYFTNQFEKIARMGMAEIYLNHTTNTIDVSKSFWTIYPTVDYHLPQKNWSPFLYQDEILLISSINPFHTMKTTNHDHPDKLYAYRESVSDYIPLKWSYGELRGGTNAVFLPTQQVYMSVFHSASHVEGNFMKTYVFGFYTFSSTPPFRLLSISHFPVLDPGFYSGPWHHMKQRQIDYCIFPLSLFIEHNSDLYISMGYQDHTGYLLRMDLTEVLNTLVEVNHVNTTTITSTV